MFPPSAGFSIDVVPGSNTAIIYGGGCVKNKKRTRTSDIFIMSCTKNSVVCNNYIYNILISTYIITCIIIILHV